jgi:transcriptional regulator with XRE-family HTH domain
MRREPFDTLIAGLEDQGISRTEIAQATGLSRDTIWRLATGTARQPYFQTIDRLQDFAAARKNFDAVRPIGQKMR